LIENNILKRTPAKELENLTLEKINLSEKVQEIKRC